VSIDFECFFRGLLSFVYAGFSVLRYTCCMLTYQLKNDFSLAAFKIQFLASKRSPGKPAVVLKMIKRNCFLCMKPMCRQRRVVWRSLPEKASKILPIFDAMAASCQEFEKSKTDLWHECQISLP